MGKKISQLIDNELDDFERDQIIETLLSDSSQCLTWQHYHMIRDVMRCEAIRAGEDISSRIAQALVNEPAAITQRIVTDRYKVKTRSQWQPVFMMAIAASLTVIAVLILPPLPGRDDLRQQNLTQTQHNALKAQKFSHEFQTMLAVHGEFTSQSGLNGLTSYARLVSNQQLSQ